MSDTPHFSRDVIVRTRDLPAAVRFYSSVLALPISHQSQNLVGFETGSFCLYVEKGAEHPPVFEMLVADVSTTKSRLLAAGCVLVEENLDLPRCYLRDPCGITFNLGRRAK
jgi:catechol 2,3-dioxygenase-like lactoylglutathione lyase family enzyme